MSSCREAARCAQRATAGATRAASGWARRPRCPPASTRTESLTPVATSSTVKATALGARRGGPCRARAPRARGMAAARPTGSDGARDPAAAGHATEDANGSDSSLTGPPRRLQRPTAPGAPQPESIMAWAAAGAGGKRVAPSAARNSLPIVEAIDRLCQEHFDTGKGALRDSGSAGAAAVDAAGAGPAAHGSGGASGSGSGDASTTRDAARLLRVLEVSSGTGQHMAAALAHARLGARLAQWQASELDAATLPSIAAYAADFPPERAPPPIRLDASEPASWPRADEPYDIVYNCNMIHISPFECCRGLFAGAARVLGSDGIVVTYGPYHDGGPTAPSNASFDESLRARDSRWGVREIAEVEAAAGTAGFALRRRVDMPANNLMLMWAREPG